MYMKWKVEKQFYKQSMEKQNGIMIQANIPIPLQSISTISIISQNFSPVFVHMFFLLHLSFIAKQFTYCLKFSDILC